MTLETRERWAVELAKTAHERFSYVKGPAPKRMVWKMSIDLSRPLVPSMGQHDALDGLVVVATLMKSGLLAEHERVALHAELHALLEMCRGQSFATSDPLGIGGLLSDAARLRRLVSTRAQTPLDGGLAVLEPVAAQVLDDAARSLAAYPSERALEEEAALRLAFRELGLSLGLAAAERVLDEGDDRLAPYLPLRDVIESFWLEPEHQAAETWREHCDINSVMLAASLAA